MSAFVFAYGYVCVIKLGILKMICRLLGINTMGRVEVYAWFEDQYNLTPFYFGEGFQYIRRYMEFGRGNWLVNAFHNLHNSILQIYIETGFWGFFMWFGFLLVLIPKKVRSIYGSNGYNVFLTTNPYGAWKWNCSTKTKSSATSASVSRYNGKKFKKYQNYYVRIVTRRKQNGVFRPVPAPTAAYYQYKFYLYNKKK